MPSVSHIANTTLQAIRRLRPLDFWVALRDALSFPGLAGVLWSRPVAIVALVGVVLGAFVFPPHGFSSFEMCQFYASTRLPCAGCGLTRSVSCFFQGYWQLSFAYHPLGPVIAVVMAAVALGAVMPERWRLWGVARIERVEAWIGWFLALLVLALLAYGIARLALVSGGYEPLQWWRTGQPPL